jgi:hypothetical protein
MKVKERKDMTKLRLNHGELNIAIDKKGNVLEWGEDDSDGYKMKWMLSLSAKDLDNIAAKSRITAEVGRKIDDLLKAIENLPVTVIYTKTGHDVTADFYTDDIEHDLNGEVTFGCQTISAEDVARVHAISRKARGLKPIK